MNNQQEPQAPAQADEHDAHGPNFLLAQSELLHQEDPSMIVLPDEREWAFSIKRAVNEADHLDPLADFEYVQYAIITQGDVAGALDRIEGMQTFKREYNIDNSVEQGIEHLRLDMELISPGFLLHLDTCPETNGPIIVCDYSDFDPKFIRSACPDRGPDYYWRTYVVTSYYKVYTCQPTFASIREGLVLLVDCAEVEWTNLSIDFETQMTEELRRFYPLKYKKVLAYNTHLIANLGWSLFKKFMSPSMRETLKVGCKIIGPVSNVETETPTRLHELFMQPSKEVVQNNLLQRARDLLTIRTENTRKFKL